jgi:hypothetical protein
MHEMRHDLTQCTTIGTCADRKKFGYLKDDNGDVIGLGSSLGKPRSSSLEKKKNPSARRCIQKYHFKAGV